MARCVDEHKTKKNSSKMLMPIVNGPRSSLTWKIFVRKWVKIPKARAERPE